MSDCGPTTRIAFLRTEIVASSSSRRSLDLDCYVFFHLKLIGVFAEPTNTGKASVGTHLNRANCSTGSSFIARLAFRVDT